MEGGTALRLWTVRAGRRPGFDGGVPEDEAEYPGCAGQGSGAEAGRPDGEAKVQETPLGTILQSHNYYLSR